MIKVITGIRRCGKSYRKSYLLFELFKKHLIDNGVEDNQIKINQETLGLNRIMDSFNKIVVVKDYYVPWYDEKGIMYIGLEDFLLNPNSLDL